jgi:hypothetical protein
LRPLTGWETVPIAFAVVGRPQDVDRRLGQHQPDELTLANVRDGVIKYMNLRKNKLQLLCSTFLDHIEALERKLGIEKAKVEKAKVEHKVLAQVLVVHKAEYKELKITSTPIKTFELKAELKELKETVKDLELELRPEKAEALHNVQLRAELKELKESVFVNKDKNGTNFPCNEEEKSANNILQRPPLQDLQRGGRRQGCGQHGRRNLRQGGRCQRDLQRGEVGQAGQAGQVGPQTCGACRRTSRCRRRPRTSRGRSAR